MPNIQLTGNQSDFLKIVASAAGRGDLEIVRQLVDDNPAWIHTVGSHGRTMLWEAAYRGKLAVVQFLFERGADINLPGCYHIEHRLEITPYCAARHKGRDSVSRIIYSSTARQSTFILPPTSEITKLSARTSIMMQISSTADTFRR